MQTRHLYHHFSIFFGNNVYLEFLANVMIAVLPSGELGSFMNEIHWMCQVDNVEGNSVAMLDEDCTRRTN